MKIKKVKVKCNRKKLPRTLVRMRRGAKFDPFVK